MIPQSVILLGGKGTRLAEHFPDRPKALVPVGGRPFIEWQLDWLQANGITRVLLAAGHMADVLERYLDGRPADALEITLSREPHPLGTGGALKFVEPLLATDPVLVLNGDTLAPNLSFSTPWKQGLSRFSGIFHAVENPTGFFHAVENSFPQRGKLFIAPIADPGRYGTVEFGEDALVTAFREKAERTAGFVNAGFYLLPREIITAIPADRPVSIETDLFPSLAAERQLAALPCPPPLLDMGTPDGLAEMERFLACL